MEIHSLAGIQYMHVSGTHRLLTEQLRAAQKSSSEHEDRSELRVVLWSRFRNVASVVG
jgi:hypothetical protein